ncbi:MAG TPA: transglutaminase family protein [Ferruginibacter sp.]|nr:transglutaminase family protein [Ferruginibacter sp.]HMP20345.1 transglutaminase family protein [Ferruginibacter sp.]
MLYQITHTTTYHYNETVPQCHNIAMLTPRNTPTQSCNSFSLHISPQPAISEEYTDFFGNRLHCFVIEQEHETLTVTATSVIKKNGQAALSVPYSITSWESTRDMLAHSTGNMLDEKQYSIADNITKANAAVQEYAAVSFWPGRPLYEAAMDMMQRIYTDFKYTAGFTTVSTPIAEVMQERKGVCQDFAHLAIACFQAMGLAARYISGYLETIPAPGKEKLKGVDASHAWFSVFIPGMGWVDFDPTNNKIPDEQYITIGWGRHYFDVVPLRGVIMSSRNHTLTVSVDVKRVDMY